MKKILFLTLLSVIFTMTAMAQQPAKTFSITPKVGFGWGDLTGSPVFSTSVGYMTMDEGFTVLHSGETTIDGAGTYGTTLNHSKFTFTGGVEAQYQFNRVLGLVFGVGYRHTSLDYDYYHVDRTRPDTPKETFLVHEIKDANWRADYICVPVMLSAYVYQSLAVVAGLQVDYMFHQTAESYVYYTPAEGYYVHAACGVGDQRKVSLSIPVGLSCEYKNVVLDVRYNFGLTNLMRGSFDGGEAPSSRTMAFGVTLGYKFTFGKK